MHAWLHLLHISSQNILFSDNNQHSAVDAISLNFTETLQPHGFTIILLKADATTA